MTDRQRQASTGTLLELWEEELTTPEDLHAYIARTLGFPPYYGGNLAALSDCLEDITQPCAIEIRREALGRRKPWFDGFCTVIMRSARENPAIQLHVEERDGGGATLDEILARIERIDRRLDALQEQREAVSSGAVQHVAAPKPVSAGATCRNLASGSDGDRFKCSVCGCRVSDYLEEGRMLIDGLRYCPQCGREVTNPQGSNALGWVGELI